MPVGRDSTIGDGQEWHCRVAETGNEIKVEPIRLVRADHLRRTPTRAVEAKPPADRSEAALSVLSKSDLGKLVKQVLSVLVEDAPPAILARLRKALEVPDATDFRKIRQQQDAILQAWSSKNFDPLIARINNLEARVSELGQVIERVGRSDQDLPEPLIGDHLHPTAQEVERVILHHLVRFDAWGGRHTDGQHLRRGPLAKASNKAVQSVVDALVRREYLIPHGKRPDEQFSLNPAKARAIYRSVGLPERHAEDAAVRTRAREETRDNERAAFIKQILKELDERYASEGKTRNALAGLRKQVSDTGARAEQPAFRARLESMIQRLEEDAAKVVARQSSLEQEVAQVEVAQLALEGHLKDHLSSTDHSRTSSNS